MQSSQESQEDEKTFDVVAHDVSSIQEPHVKSVLRRVTYLLTKWGIETNG